MDPYKPINPGTLFGVYLRIYNHQEARRRAREAEREDIRHQALVDEIHRPEGRARVRAAHERIAEQRRNGFL